MNCESAGKRNYARVSYYDAPHPTDAQQLMSTGYAYNFDRQLLTTTLPGESGIITRTYNDTTGRLTLPPKFLEVRTDGTSLPCPAKSPSYSITLRTSHPPTTGPST